MWCLKKQIQHLINSENPFVNGADMCVQRSRQDAFREENCSQGLLFHSSQPAYLRQTDSSHGYMFQIRECGSSCRVHRLKFSVDQKMSPRHEWACQFSSASPANDGFTLSPSCNPWGLAWFCLLFVGLSHAETEVVVKQIRFYGAKYCETELIRAWHFKLDWAIKLVMTLLFQEPGSRFAILSKDNSYFV